MNHESNLKHSSNLKLNNVCLFTSLQTLKISFSTTSFCYILVYGPAVWSSPRKRKRTDIKEDDSSTQEDENILDYSTDSSSNNHGSNVNEIVN